MDLSRVILGPIVTEKAERQKAEARTHTLRVAKRATKIDVKSALKKFYDVDVTNVRVVRVPSKHRAVRGGVMEKRHPYKKVLVTLGAKSKALDLASFKIS